MIPRVTAVRDLVNAGLDCLPRPTVRMLGIEVRSYALFVIGGSLSGAATAVVLAGLTGLSLTVTGVLLAIAVAAALGFAVVTRLLRGREAFTFYHYQIASLLACGAALVFFNLPVAAYLDVLVVGLAMTHAWGRIGCLLVGCCHGRPSSVGIRYDGRHVAVGLPRYWVGIRLIPIQLAESAALFVLVATGATTVLSAAAPGSATGGYLVAYASLRILLEGFRGDERPSRGALSEGRLTAVGSILLVVVAQAAGLLPFTWSSGVLGAIGLGLVIATAVADVSRPIAGCRRAELSLALRSLLVRVEEDGGVLLTTVDSGLTLSASAVALADGPEKGITYVVTCSRCPETLSASAASEVAREVGRWVCPEASINRLVGVAGAFHFVWHRGELAYAL